MILNQNESISNYLLSYNISSRYSSTDNFTSSKSKSSATLPTSFDMIFNLFDSAEIFELDLLLPLAALIIAGVFESFLRLQSHKTFELLINFS